MTQSAKALFRATRAKPEGTPLPIDLPADPKPATRDPLDFDPTPPEATGAFLAVEGAALRAHGPAVWEAAVGAGHIARVLAEHGFDVIGSDIVDRGWPGTEVASLYDFATPPAPAMLTNPPYNEINARDGHGRWLRHALDIGCTYIGLLLNADWPAARINGMDALFRAHPPSVEYLCTWKIDFRGGGSPPHRSSWFVWDTRRPALRPDCWERRRLYRDTPDPNQEALGL